MRQPAVTEAQFAQAVQFRLAVPCQHDLAGDVFADDAQFTDTVQQHAWDVVIADQQHIDRKVPAVPEKLVLAASETQATAFQNVQGFFRQPAGFLNGYA